MITSDACATPGCGHSKQQHGPNGCHYIGVRDYVWGCSCTAYLPPRPVPEEGPEGPETSYNVCKCGHRESWHNTPYRPNCTGSFGECPCFVFEFDHAWPPATVPAPHADAEAAWREFFRLHHNSLRLTVEELRREAFIAGYLRGRGDRG